MESQLCNYGGQQIDGYLIDVVRSSQGLGQNTEIPRA